MEGEEAFLEEEAFLLVCMMSAGQPLSPSDQRRFTQAMGLDSAGRKSLKELHDLEQELSLERKQLHAAMALSLQDLPEGVPPEAQPEPNCYMWPQPEPEPEPEPEPDLPEGVPPGDRERELRAQAAIRRMKPI